MKSHVKEEEWTLQPIEKGEKEKKGYYLKRTLLEKKWRRNLHEFKGRQEIDLDGYETDEKFYRRNMKCWNKVLNKNEKCFD